MLSREQSVEKEPERQSQKCASPEVKETLVKCCTPPVCHQQSRDKQGELIQDLMNQVIEMNNWRKQSVLESVEKDRLDL